MKRVALPLLFLATSAISVNAAEITYTQHIKPIFDARCAACHGADAPEYPAFKKEKDAYVAKGIGPRMETYTHLVYFTGWPDTGALMRRLDDGANGKDGKAGNMYQHLGADDTERQANLALFKTWVGHWTPKRFDALTKDDLAAIEIPY